MNVNFRFVFALLWMGLNITVVQSQIRPINQDESKVPPYTVPDVLVGKDGTKVVSAEGWLNQRQYLLDLLAQHEFGTLPTAKVDVASELIEEGAMADGHTWRRQVRIRLSRTLPDGSKPSVAIDLAIFKPVDSAKPVPCFVSLNFQGNHTMTEDPKMIVPTSWVREEKGITQGNQATEAGRGTSSKRWPISEITKRGFAVAAAYYGDIDPDFDDGFKNGVHPLFPEHLSDEAHPDRWGSIGAWAWGLQRIVDVLEKEKGLHPSSMMVVGHSRLGKAALWAGATDPRFRIVYSNNSGCGGAALSKRVFGESVARINTSFPHWFCRNFRNYNDKEETLPVEQNMLIAAIAPRPVYIASATKDLWADPKGEYLSGWHATAAYRLLGLEGLPQEEMPAPETPVGGSIGFHLRTGDHDILLYDWERYMDFAEKHLH